MLTAQKLKLVIRLLLAAEGFAFIEPVRRCEGKRIEYFAVSQHNIAAVNGVFIQRILFTTAGPDFFQAAETTAKSGSDPLTLRPLPYGERELS